MKYPIIYLLAILEMTGLCLHRRRKEMQFYSTVCEAFPEPLVHSSALADYWGNVLWTRRSKTHTGCLSNETATRNCPRSRALLGKCL